MSFLSSSEKHFARIGLSKSHIKSDPELSIRDFTDQGASTKRTIPRGMRSIHT